MTEELKKNPQVPTSGKDSVESAPRSPFSRDLHPFGSYRPKRDFRLVPPLCIGLWPALFFLNGTGP